MSVDNERVRKLHLSAQLLKETRGKRQLKRGHEKRGGKKMEREGKSEGKER